MPGGLTRRTQILLDEQRYARLEHRARASGRSVASLLREAIDLLLASPSDEARRRQAARTLLEAPEPPGEGPEPDWEKVKYAQLEEA